MLFVYSGIPSLVDYIFFVIGGMPEYVDNYIYIYVYNYNASRGDPSERLALRNVSDADASLTWHGILLRSLAPPGARSLRSLNLIGEYILN